MQNTPQTFRNTSAPGVNFTEHAYENHLGSHCPPGSYQTYPNSPYHPVQSSRPHHYGNPQMQPNMPYRHHGGAYAPNQNQYAAGMNQEVYRNHHSGYVGANNRNIPPKPWPENNSPDLMPPYGQVTSHPQMMNNSPQMPVTSMRSPPQATSNMNPAASQGQQHYRPMQSPAHSPHSWSQAQIPSPGVMHSSRTTPSPLSTHVRSPGHSQPFSPPTAMNMQPIPPPPENGQLPQAVNNASGNDNHNPSNPLHSLQKMVMLDQDPKSSIMPIPADTEQFGNQCGSHNYVPEESASNESKDSAYSTYYNMDENRFESKPNNTDNDTSVYSSVQQVSNCNFPITSNPVGHDDSKIASIPHCGPNSNAPEGFLSDQSNVSISKSSNLDQPQCKTSVLQNDCAMQLNPCPPHAESAPIFTDQTKAAVSTNSEQALPTTTTTNWINEDKSNSNSHLAEIPNADIAGIPDSVSECGPVLSKQSEVFDDSDVKVKSEKDVDKENEIVNDVENESQNPCSNLSLGKSSEGSELSNSVSEPDVKEENPTPISDCLEEIKKEKLNPAIIKLSCSIEANVESNDSKTDLPLTEENTVEKDSKKPSLRRRKVGASYEEAPSPEQDLKSGAAADSHSPKRSKDVKTDCKKSKNNTINQNNSEDTSKKESLRNPVKVVIHRIRKSDTNDIWHVPGNTSQEECESEVKHQKVESKPSNTSPQIIMLSSAVSEKKETRTTSTPESNISIKQEDVDDIEVIDVELTTAAVKDESTNSPQKISSANYSDKKRGRPVGSRNKFKPTNQLKKKRGKKGCKKRKNDVTKPKAPEVPGKAKKAKNFNGPYVHIIGSKESPSSISVVNVAQKEEEKVNKIPLKRNFNTSTISRIKKKPVGHLSTLSPTYDAFNRDKTWLCIFCHKGSHQAGLGDLYGPYYIKDKNGELDVKNTSNSSGTSNPKSKRRKSDHDDSKGPKKARQSSGQSSGESNLGGKQGSKQSTDVEVSESGEPLREVWIHEDCVVWCQSVSLMGEEVHGLEEAITEAKENICCHCKLDGATVGCWGKGCKEQYHFSCAKETGCQMDIENFSLLCPEHQKKHGRQHSPCQ